MIVIMRTKAKADKLANLTGGQVIPDSKGQPISKVSLSEDFEQYRSAVESVSVLFQLRGDAGEKVPSGWTMTGASFEVEWPKDPERVTCIRSHFGARHYYAYNWALARVKSDLETKSSSPDYETLPWTLEALRKQWNAEKNEVAPWWGDNSKEAYASGITDLMQTLSNWSQSKQGKRKGGRVGFPRFKSRRNDQSRVRFTTGAMRFEDDRRTIVLPTIGALRSKENTRRVQRHLSRNNARLLSCTLSQRWGRLFVSCQPAVRTQVVSPTHKSPPNVRAGVDLGLRSLATVVDSNDTVNVHQLTRYLVDTCSEIKIGDLNLAVMKRSMGRRGFRRSVSDAGLGAFRPTLTYKAERGGVKVIVINRFFPSSQIHHRCGNRLTGAKLAKRLTSNTCNIDADRDENAAMNIRDRSDTSPGLVEASALFVPRPFGTDGSSDDGTTHRLGRADKTSPCTGDARRGGNKSWTGQCRVQDENLVKGASSMDTLFITQMQRSHTS